jgi:hypothetical protein
MHLTTIKSLKAGSGIARNRVLLASSAGYFQSNRGIVMVQGRSSGADAKSLSSSEWGTFSIAKMYMTTNIAHLSTFL